MRPIWHATTLAIWALGTLLLPAPAAASDFVVSDLRDAPLATPGGTTCMATTGTCTLRAALQAAQNSGVGPHQVTVVAAGTFFLARELGALTMDGTTVTLRNASGATV